MTRRGNAVFNRLGGKQLPNGQQVGECRRHFQIVGKIQGLPAVLRV